MTAQEFIEKFKAEIERRIKSWQTRGEHSPEGQGKDTCVSRVTELTDLLSVLSALEKEEKPIEGLEEEIQHQVYDCLFDLDGVAIKGTSAYASVDDVAYIARHFAQWQKEKDKVKNTEIARRAINGYKEAMMQMAVEGYVDKDYIVTEGPSYFIRSVNLDLPNGVKDGDKVKIIVVKKD